MKRKDILTPAATWMNLEDILLSDISQTQKDKYYMIPLIRGPEDSQIHRNRKYKGGCQGLGKGDGESVFYGHRVSVWEHEKILAMDGGDGCTKCECNQRH